MALTERQKEKIRAEEIFRFEVSKSLEKEYKKRHFASRKDCIFNLLNQPFSIWLISAIFITILPFLYSQYSEVNSENKAIREKVNRIDLELSYRLHNIKVSDKTDSPDEIYRKLLQFRVGPFLFEEYSERRSETLIYELYTLSNKSEKLLLSKAFQATILIPELIDSLFYKRTKKFMHPPKGAIDFIHFDPDSGWVHSHLDHDYLCDTLASYAVADVNILKQNDISIFEYMEFMKDLQYRKAVLKALSDISLPRWKDITIKRN